MGGAMTVVMIVMMGGCWSALHGHSCDAAGDAETTERGDRCTAPECRRGTLLR